MSQRIGMADGRCITESTSGRLMNDAIMAKAKIQVQDNYKYRMYLQTVEPASLGLPMTNAACGAPLKGPLMDAE